MIEVQFFGIFLFKIFWYALHQLVIFKPGALVLAKFGVFSIDEFNLLKKEHYTKIYEAMEQQTISSAKAGLTTSLNARTTIIVACNLVTPGQKYMSDADISENTGLPSPFLRRFDLIFILVDQVNPEVDTENCNFILEKVKLIES
jgi:DNA replicative helicase MCM subunit Mcm2 (Cdc46/Mcm family)